MNIHPEQRTGSDQIPDSEERFCKYYEIFHNFDSISLNQSNAQQKKQK